jgi:hypothetical protein
MGYKVEDVRNFWTKIWNERDEEAQKYEGEKRKWFLENCLVESCDRDIWIITYKRIDEENRNR